MSSQEPIVLDAVRLRSGTWCVRPKGQLGTMGWYPRAWTAVFVKARSAAEAIAKAAKLPRR